MKSIFHSLFNKSIWNKKQKIFFHDAGNISLFFKTNIKYICLKANTFKSLTITNNADAFASSTKGWVQL